MSRALEHDHLGLIESSCELKQTELTLGLPDYQSPERRPALISVSLFGTELQHNDHSSNAKCCLGSLKCPVSGAKRVYSDTIKWTFSAYNEASSGKGAVISSFPVVENLAKQLGGSEKIICTTQHACASATAVKEEIVQEMKSQLSAVDERGGSPASKKNAMASNLAKNNDYAENDPSGYLYVKVSMEGAPYLRKIDLGTYKNYIELSLALEKMFSSFSYGKDEPCKIQLSDVLDGSEYVLTYEDKDGDWMLVGDVPWEMFTDSCRRLKIMRGSEATGLAPTTMEKLKSRN